MRIMIGKSSVEAVQGDITKDYSHAIVNAANKTLLGGGGVDGAIHRAGGPEILEQCHRLNGCDTGDAKITTGGRLPAKYVIHTVGPVYHDGKHNEPELLASCHRRSLEVALSNGVRTVAFPAISCGAYGYPVPKAAAIAIKTVRTFLQKHQEIERVRFVLFDADALRVFAGELERQGNAGKE